MMPEIEPPDFDDLSGEGALRAVLLLLAQPIWRDAIAAMQELRKIEAQRVTEQVRANDLEERRLDIYAARTEMLRNEVLPKLMPVTVTALLLLVGWAALQLGVPLPAPG